MKPIEYLEELRCPYCYACSDYGYITYMCFMAKLIGDDFTEECTNLDYERCPLRAI